MFDREWTLHHIHDHRTVQACVDVPMGSVHRDEHGLSSLDGLRLGPNDNNPFTLQAKHDCIRNRMAVQAILLSWLKAVHVAMELICLPDPLSNVFFSIG
jgi:hypothetical protein